MGEIAASGLIFKDTINIEAFKDPKVRQTPPPCSTHTHAQQPVRPTVSPKPVS